MKGARKDSANNSMVYNKKSLLEQYMKIDKKKAIQDIYVRGNTEMVSTALALKSKLFPKFDQFQTKKVAMKKKKTINKSWDGVIDLTNAAANRYAERPDWFATTNDSLPPLERASKNHSIVSSEYNESGKGSRKSSKKWSRWSSSKDHTRNSINQNDSSLVKGSRSSDRSKSNKKSTSRKRKRSTEKYEGVMLIGSKRGVHLKESLNSLKSNMPELI